MGRPWEGRYRREVLRIQSGEMRESHDGTVIIGCAPEMGAIHKLINADDEEARIEAFLPPDATVLIVTRRRAAPNEIDQRL